MNPFTFIKRGFQAAGCLIIVVVMAGSSLLSYVDGNREAQDRMELIGKHAEMQVDEDSSFLEKVGAMISAWWESDELIAEEAQDKALEAESKKKREERERERAFNESQHSGNDDYYGLPD